MGLRDHFIKKQKEKRIEKACLLFCPESDSVKIMDRIEIFFGGSGGAKTNNYTLQNGDMKIFLAACGASDNNANGTYAKEQLNGVQGFVYRIETDQGDVKLNLFYHLRQCKSVLRVIYSYEGTGSRKSEGKEQEIRSLILRVTDLLQGVATFGDGTAFLDGQGRLILDSKGRTELDYYMPAEMLPGRNGGRICPGSAGSGGIGPWHG